MARRRGKVSQLGVNDAIRGGVITYRCPRIRHAQIAKLASEEGVSINAYLDKIIERELDGKFQDQRGSSDAHAEGSTPEPNGLEGDSPVLR